VRSLRGKSVKKVIVDLPEGAGNMKRALILLFTLFSCLCMVSAQEQLTSAKPDMKWTGSVEQKVWGLMVVWSEAKYAFPFFNRIPKVDWDAKAQEYLPRVIAAPDIEAYYHVLMEFAALLNDGHTAVNPPWGPFKPGTDSPPLEVQVVEGRFVVARTGDTDELRSHHIYPGLEIVEVGDGVPVRSYFRDSVLRYNSRGTGQADEAINMYDLLTGPKDSKIALKVRDIDGAVRSVEVTRNSADRSGNRFMYRLFRWYMADPVLESRVLPDGILYVKIANFDKEELQNQFRELIDKLDRTSIGGMVIDLRYNPGGNSSIAESVTQCLIDRPMTSFVSKVPHYLAAERAWGHEPVWTEIKREIQPREGKRYLGPIAILTGPATYSSAEDFIVPLHCAKRVILVGEKTAGSTGNPLRVPLPGGGNFRVVTVKCVYPDGREFVGTGIQPDVEVHPTQQDIYDGYDRVLASGVEEIMKLTTHGRS
jgi:C-terminal processing protease CtpA/Prc